MEEVKAHLHLDVAVEVAPLDVLPPEYRHSYQAISEVAGTFQDDGGTSIIRYDPVHLKQPVQFINLVAHELMHARLHDVVHEVPGGEEAHELATDLGCVIAGFGVFQLQAADEAGWFGYLSQQSRAVALAVLLDRRGLGTQTLEPYLSSRCQKLLGKGVKSL
ncbi:MAG: hypothetical protein AAF393_14560 [Pseudomonadota bacterium]